MADKNDPTTATEAATQPALEEMNAMARTMVQQVPEVTSGRDTDLRNLALTHAIAHGNTKGHTANDIVGAADKFYRWLKGEKAVA